MLRSRSDTLALNYHTPTKHLELSPFVASLSSGTLSILNHLNRNAAMDKTSLDILEHICYY